MVRMVIYKTYLIEWLLDCKRGDGYYETPLFGVRTTPNPHHPKQILPLLTSLYSILPSQ